MRTYFVVFVPLLVCCCVVKTSRGQCVKEDSYQDEVAIKVIFEFKSAANRTDRIYKSLEPRLKPPKSYEERPSQENIVGDRLESLFCLAPSDVPPLNSPFLIYFGPRKYSINSRPTTWRETDFKDPNGKKFREGTMSTIFLLNQPDPDWPVIQSSRVLQGAGEKKWLLEAIVDNKSDRPVALEELLIEASHPSPDNVACGGPDPGEELTLSWSKVISREKDGVWTTFGDSKVRARVSYNGAGHCSAFWFSASIPIRYNIPDRQVIRIEIKVNEMPSPRRTRDLPPPLARWRSLGISLKPSVYPSWVTVNR